MSKLVVSADDDGTDRDTWCTSSEWTARIGRVWGDPCSNDRATVDAEWTWDYEKRGQNALVLAKYLPPKRRQKGPLFINPPYSRGMVARFVEAFCRSRFIFLVRADVSTGWWEALWPYVSVECRPMTRKLFTPPPGETDTGNVFPHSLLYSDAIDVTAEVLSASYVTVPAHALSRLEGTALCRSSR